MSLESSVGRAAVQTLKSFEPATGALLGEVPISSRQTVEKTIARAKKAQAAWGVLPIEERCARLLPPAPRRGIVRSSAASVLAGRADSASTAAASATALVRSRSERPISGPCSWAARSGVAGFPCSFSAESTGFEPLVGCRAEGRSGAQRPPPQARVERLTVRGAASTIALRRHPLGGVRR
jgi:hypothetical protein